MAAHRLPATHRPIAKLCWKMAINLALLALGSVFVVMLGSRSFECMTLTVHTGSMDPSLPAGSMVLVCPVDSSDVRTGDVVLLVRDDQKLPVLHRVTSTETTDGRVVVTTKGDANKAEDAGSYLLTDKAMVHRLHVPAVGRVTAWLTTASGWIIGAVIPSTVISGLILCQIWSKPASTPLAAP